MANATYMVKRNYRFQGLGYLLGSAVRDDLHAGSDVDLLVEFDAAAKIDFMALARMQRELGAMFQRPIDMVPRSGLKPILREDVLRSARPTPNEFGASECKTG